jgi:cell division protein FtsN
MTNEKQFRELKFTSTQLAIVFLAILAFGVCIFLLGISVGKKQTQLAAGAGGAPAVKTETLAQKSPLPANTPPTVTIQPRPGQATPPDTKTEAKPAETKTDDKAGAKVKAKSEAKPPTAPGGKPAEVKPAPEEKKPVESKAEPAKKPGPPAAAKKEGIFYVQIGAVNDKEAADGFAQKVGKLGYPALVLMPLATDKRPVYRIRIGPYENKQNANDAQEKIAADLKKKKTDFFVVKG